MTEEQEYSSSHKFLRVENERIADFRMTTYVPNEEEPPTEVKVVEYKGVDGIMIIVEDERIIIQGGTTLNDQIMAACFLVESTTTRIAKNASNPIVAAFEAANMLDGIQEHFHRGFSEVIREEMEDLFEEDQE